MLVETDGGRDRGAAYHRRMSRRDVLAEICAATRREVSVRKEENPEIDISGAPPVRHLDLDSFGIIAEVKRSSPSAGAIAGEVDPAVQAGKYAAAGAAAVSVLTERNWFGGDLADLTSVRAAVGVPVLRKDFVLDPWQVAESRRAGADLVLVIVAALSAGEAVDLAAEVRRLGMTPLVEVHGRDEVGVALEAVAAGGILGVNARDLSSLDIDLSVWEAVACEIPADVTAVAESGVKKPADVARAAAAGYAGVLCGETLMRASDPGILLTEMLAAAGV